MSTRRVLFWLAFSGKVAALIGCLVSAALPMGQLPKIAGPCGRELCECKLEEPCKDERPDCPFRAPEARLVFSDDVFTPAVPNNVLVSVISDFSAPSSFVFIAPAAESIDALPQSALFALSNPSDEILTPPPRA